MTNETATKPRRSKGDGTIFKNDKGRGIAQYNRTGTSPKELSGKTKAEVKAKLDEYKFLVQSGDAGSLKLSVEQYSIKFLHYKSQQVMRKNRSRLHMTARSPFLKVISNRIPYPGF